MGISHHMGLHRLPADTAASSASTIADVRLDIDFLDSEEAYERVLLGEVELGVITLAPEEKPSLQQIPIWNDELVVTVARNHPLATQTARQRASAEPVPRHFAGSEYVHGAHCQSVIRTAEITARCVDVDELSGDDQGDGVDWIGLERAAENTD